MRGEAFVGERRERARLAPWASACGLARRIASARVEPRPSRAESIAASLRGVRVALCEPSWSDEEEFVALRLASREFLAPWEATLEGLDPFGPERFRRFMARGPTRRRFLIRSRDGGELVGALSFSEVDRARRTATVGYWIGAEHARQGLMSEALPLGLAWACSELDLERIDAYVLPENDASIALLVKCGFALDAVVPRYRVVAGRMRDHERWTLALAADARASASPE